MKDLLRGHSKLNHKTMILVKTKRKTRRTTSEAITKRIRKELIHIAFITKKKIIIHKGAGGDQMSSATIVVN